MPEHRYDPHAIERRWQELWARERTWEVSNRDPSHTRGSRSRIGAVTGAPADEPDTYVLEMLPYPSGEPHIGHLKCYSLGDAIAHYYRRRGARVLHPMGYDAFGLPAENHAIRNGVHPRVSTAESSPPSSEQIRSWGISIDWSRELATSEPDYYRWTQWIFLKLFRAGLAYRSDAAVKWCPNDQTVLANEQVESTAAASAAGRGRVRQLEQWMFRITDYAERLLERPRRDRLARARDDHAAQLDRPLRGGRGELPLRGARRRLRRLHDPARHALRRDLLRAGPRASARRAPRRGPPSTSGPSATTSTTRSPRATRSAARREGEDRGAARRTAINPVNGERIPIWVADYVLMEYGTGAIMAVPAHDERDFAFARAFGLPIMRVIAPAAGERRGGRGASCPTPATACSSTPTRVRRACRNREALGGDRRVARPRGQGPRVGQLPPARLADLPSALLGLPDPDRLLRALRDRAGARRGAAGGAARDRGLHAEGPLAARRGRGLGATPAVRSAADRRAARPTRWTPSSTPPGTSCATATPHNDAAAWDPAALR